MTRAAIVRTDRYGKVAIAFHWTIAALVLFNLIVGLFHEGPLRPYGLMPAHKAVGILVLVLTLGRIGWRLGHPVPPLPAGLPSWERTAARATHAVFYALLLLIPLSGWAMASLSKTPRPIDWFGLFQVPLLPVGKGVAGAAHEFHELGGYLFALLVVLHIAAALRHQFVLRDGYLARMWPGLARSGG